MKKYLVWFSLLMKRMVKIPAFVLMLAGLLILAIVVAKLEQGERAEAAVGVMLEAGAEEAASEEAASESYEEWNQSFLSRLHEQKGITVFQVYENKEQLIQDVEKGKLDCGFILSQNLQDRINEGTWQGAIAVYSSSESAVTEIAKERIAAAVFTLYSEESYVNYIKNIPAFNSSQIIAFAKNAYETHLLDGSTFDLIYNGYNGSEDFKSESRSEPQAAAVTFPLRGILAVCIFLSGMCGLLIDWKDRQEKRFLRIAPNWMTTAVNIWIPTIYTAGISVVALLCTNQIAGLGGFGGELLRLLIYQFLIVVYCSIIRFVLRKQETIAAAIPILTLACVICCPVWIRLATYIPVFRILEKLFPATYYLLKK